MSDEEARKNERDYLEKFYSEAEAQEGSRHYEAFKIAVENRKFEIEMYWKRATYFWVFIAATFAGYWAVYEPKVDSSGNITKNSDEVLSLLLACLGYILSLLWHLANRGSKQWQENWEFHIDHLEDKVTGPLYKSIFRRIQPKKQGDRIFNKLIGPGDHSVSKINQIVSLSTTILWFLIICYTLRTWAPEFWGWCKLLVAGVVVAVITAMIVKVCSGKKDLRPPPKSENNDPNDRPHYLNVRSSTIVRPDQER